MDEAACVSSEGWPVVCQLVTSLSSGGGVYQPWEAQRWIARSISGSA
jgi:hypothetical protein